MKLLTLSLRFTMNLTYTNVAVEQNNENTMKPEAAASITPEKKHSAVKKHHHKKKVKHKKKQKKVKPATNTARCWHAALLSFCAWGFQLW